MQQWLTKTTGPTLHSQYIQCPTLIAKLCGLYFKYCWWWLQNINTSNILTSFPQVCKIFHLIMRYVYTKCPMTAMISMGWCKKDVTPLLTHWSYVFLALTHGYVISTSRHLCGPMLSSWWPLLGLLSWYFIFKSSLCLYLKIRHPYMKSTGPGSSNELQRLHCMSRTQASFPSNGPQSTCPIKDRHIISTTFNSVVPQTVLQYYSIWHQTRIAGMAISQ